jgi:hypothetical protein
MRKEDGMKRYAFSRLFLTILILVFSLVAPKIVWAGPLVFDPSVSNCTGINCSSTTYNGSTILDQFNSANPFILQVFAPDANLCLRIAVSAQTGNTEIVLVSPTGQVWRNDNRGAGDTRPLVKAITDVAGWYTLQVSHSAGSGDVDFTLNYGVYTPGTNPNCSSPTTPFVDREEDEKRLEGGASGNVPQRVPSTP